MGRVDSPNLHRVQAHEIQRLSPAAHRLHAITSDAQGYSLGRFALIGKTESASIDIKASARAGHLPGLTCAAHLAVSQCLQLVGQVVRRHLGAHKQFQGPRIDFGGQFPHFVDERSGDARIKVDKSQQADNGQGKDYFEQGALGTTHEARVYRNSV